MNEKRSVNLCSIYVLPLLGLNRYSFGSPDKFVNSYIAEDDKHVVVECLHPYNSLITNHTNYKLNFDRDNSYFAVFEIPQYYKEDVRKFKEGKYSKFTDSAKNLIRKKSGLPYKVPKVGGRYESALELLVLDRAEELRKHLEDKLAVKISNEAELGSIPGEDNFFDLKLSNRLESTT